ncbi:Juvenile hormone epoxide hydrolase 2 [Hypsibius exemplaris]|uniref:Epoxide hydrolase n=1 Tax=Hypsibius exemplaris TaxID=2072580 RepID=A0A1W0XDV3_HYPEX|nr:Juvenile hormone epoxide hydrolase 2 [Hypsibius exemplaris]
MGLLLSLTFLLFGIGSAFIGLLITQPDAVFNFLIPLPPKADVFPYNDRTWRATNEIPAKNSEIRPFRVDWPEKDLLDLKQRLENTRYGSPISDVKFTYGFPTGQVKKVVDYWLHKYDWRAQEAVLNQYPQYLTAIEGLDIHFVHYAKPQVAAKPVNTFPIALLHGWPGSFFEMYKLVPLLTTPRAIGEFDAVAFEVVIPAIPGFGFSDAAHTTGMDPCNIARIYDKLMERLGHTKYYVYGGDWGTTIARCLTVMYPEKVLGLDLTMYPVSVVPTMIRTAVASVAPSLVMDPTESYKLISNHLYTMLQEFGFTLLQSTKPDTIGAALSDTPAGLAVYILEKFTFFTRPEFINRTDGGLTEHFTMDELLTNVMVYWITNSIQSSVRIYKENCGYLNCGKLQELPRYPVTVPTVLSDFHQEVAGINPPEAFVRPYFKKLVKVSRHPEGGHFSAMERPIELAEDIWTVLTAVLQNEV